jgi:hypothetical protein
MAMPKLTHIQLVRVHYVPKALEPGLLYVSEEFGAAVHLCACGCGSKVSTPLAITEWSLHETDNGPSLRPSVGNWQLPCQSHYWIEGGKILWYGTWSPEQIEAGRRAEGGRRQRYYEDRERQREGFFRRLWRWFLSLFR